MSGRADLESRPWRWVVATLVVAVALGVAARDHRDAATDEVRTESEGPGFDSPDQAMEWILMSHRDEQGNIPRDGLMRARAQVDAMRGASRDRALRAEASGSTPAAAGISSNAWAWLGPVNIGGRVRGLVVLPDAVTLITGGVAGGIWKSTNAGGSWRVVDDFMANLAVSTIVYRPGQSSQLFAGTGEGFFNTDSIRGAGIFTSTDEGESWAQLPSTAHVDFDFVNRLAFSADGNVLMAATRTGLFRSTDLGGSWSKVHEQGNMLDVKFIAGSNALVVAATRNRTALHSSNGGVTWTTATGLTPAANLRVELAVSVSSPNVVYASVDDNSGQIWKSTDSGVSYVKVSDPGHLSGQGWYDNAIWVDPTNPDLLVAGGVSLFRSNNGGVNLAQIPNCHADQHIIVHDPGYNGTSNRRVYVGSDGGVCRMDDVVVNGVTSLRNGLGITQFYGGGGNGGAGRVMGGTQDNGTLLYNIGSGTTAWSAQFGGDGGFSAVDPSNPNILYGETQNFRIHRSLTGGAPSQYIYGGSGGTCSKPVPYQLTDACLGQANFIAPFILDPNEPNRLLAGGRSLWRSNDPRTANTGITGPSWAAIKPPTPGNFNISAIAVTPGNSDLIWVGHNNGDLYVTLNGMSLSPTWTRTDIVGSLPNRVVNSIAIDPTDPQVVYVAFGGFSADSLWRTTNLGATWQDQTGTGATGLPDAPIRSVVLHPQTRQWVYAASDVGIFTSEDGGATWSLPQDGPANVAVFQLFWMDSTLVAVTHGRGMYAAPVALAVPAFGRRPQSQAVLSGQSVTFNPIALGVGPLSFQWYRGQSGDTSDPIASATSASFSTGPITQISRFWVRVTNALGSADSNTATLTLLPWGSLLPGVTNQGAEPIIGGGTTGTGSSTAGTMNSRTSAAATSGAQSAPATGMAGSAGSSVSAAPRSPAAAFAPSRAAAAAAAPASSMANGGRVSMPYSTPASGAATPANSIQPLSSIGPIAASGSIDSSAPTRSTTVISVNVGRDGVTGSARLTDTASVGAERGRSAVAGTAAPAPPLVTAGAPQLMADVPPSPAAPIDRRPSRAARTPEAAAVTESAVGPERAPVPEPVAAAPSRLPLILVVLGLFLPPIIVAAWVSRTSVKQVS